jgi:hypothetical protein
MTRTAIEPKSKPGRYGYMLGYKRANIKKKNRHLAQINPAAATEGTSIFECKSVGDFHTFVNANQRGQVSVLQNLRCEARSMRNNVSY